MSVGRAEPAAWHRGTSRDRPCPRPHPHPGPLTDEAGGAGGVDAVAAVGAVAVGDFIVRVGGRGAHVRVLELPLEAAARDRIHLAAARMERGRAAGGGGTCHRLPSASPSCRRARHGPVGTGKESQHPGTEPHPNPFLLTRAPRARGGWRSPAPPPCSQGYGAVVLWQRSWISKATPGVPRSFPQTARRAARPPGPSSEAPRAAKKRPIFRQSPRDGAWQGGRRDPRGGGTQPRAGEGPGAEVSSSCPHFVPI